MVKLMLKVRVDERAAQSVDNPKGLNEPAHKFQTPPETENNFEQQNFTCFFAMGSATPCALCKVAFYRSVEANFPQLISS